MMMRSFFLRLKIPHTVPILFSTTGGHFYHLLIAKLCKNPQYSDFRTMALFIHSTAVFIRCNSQNPVKNQNKNQAHELGRVWRT